jgi:hypothetical protein
MIGIEELPPDQRAVLSLLLRRRKRYDEVAAALAVSASAVHDRAHAALAVLAPGKARLLEAGAREQIGEYLLGQQGAEQAAATKARLSASAPEREWARALALELVKLAAQPLPEIPAGEPADGAAAPAPRSADAGGVPSAAAAAVQASPAVTASSSTAPVSRRGGAIMLAAIAALVVAVVVVVLVSGKGGGSNVGANQTASHSGRHGGSNPGQTAQPGGGSGNSPSGTANASIEKVAELKPIGGPGTAKGAAAVAAENGKHALLLSATGMPATDGFFYVVWLIGPEGKLMPFGRTPSVGSKGTVRAVELLPENPATVSGIELTRETTEHPSSPGAVVLRGVFNHA